MSNSRVAGVLDFAVGAQRDWVLWAERQAHIGLLEVKDIDIRRSILQQAVDAVDKGVHIGGAYSSVIPLVCLFYANLLEYNVENPTSTEQDAFILSKGHAVAAMAAVYADLGYFDASVLKNSRGLSSILNGHPGPILPGVHISTGPMGQGLSVAQGFALAGKSEFKYDVYCITGDGELQEGNIWEGVMHSGGKLLDNLCVVVDHNRGQLDDPKKLHFSSPDMAAQFEAFGWRALTVDGTQYGSVLDALNVFKYTPRDGRPTAIISVTTKGFGGLSDFMVGHKVTMTDQLVEQEISLLEHERRNRVDRLCTIVQRMQQAAAGREAAERITELAGSMGYDVQRWGDTALESRPATVRLRRAQPRNKQIRYDEKALPLLDPSREYMCSDIVKASMKVFARDQRVVSIDSDLSSTSGLQAGVGWVDTRRALNVGVAEANMMCIGEAYGALGYNAWVSTFCPFFNFNVLRRIAISHQERIEAIEAADGWLSEGHGLDITFLATAANFDTKTNGATHMGNDDALVFGEIGLLKIIDISCPNLLLGVMKWIMEGNRGLVYLRLMRAGSQLVYKEPVQFSFGKGLYVSEHGSPVATIISSGRQVHESLAAAAQLKGEGIPVAVVDMPSVDIDLVSALADSPQKIIFAEQNNGYLLSSVGKTAFRRQITLPIDRIFGINSLSKQGEPLFIHSGTYEELVDCFDLSAQKLATRVRQIVE